MQPTRKIGFWSVWISSGMDASRHARDNKVRQAGKLIGIKAFAVSTPETLNHWIKTRAPDCQRKAGRNSQPIWRRICLGTTGDFLVQFQNNTALSYMVYNTGFCGDLDEKRTGGKADALPPVYVYWNYFTSMQFSRFGPTPTIDTLQPISRSIRQMYAWAFTGRSAKVLHVDKSPSNPDSSS